MSMLQKSLTLAALPAHQTRFLHALLSVWLAVPGRVNALNFSRSSGWSEKTVRRWFHRPPRQTTPHRPRSAGSVVCGTCAAAARRSGVAAGCPVSRGTRGTHSAGGAATGAGNRRHLLVQVSAVRGGGQCSFPER